MKKILATTVIGLSLGASLFYWYSYHPYLITKLCIQIATDKVANSVPRGDQTDVRYVFWKCQKEHGISE